MLQYHSDVCVWVDGAGLETSTVCLAHNATVSWNFANKDYTVRGVRVSPGSDRHSSCLGSATSVIQAHQVQQPVGLRHTNFCALSYFVDRAFDMHIVCKLTSRCQNLYCTHVFCIRQQCDCVCVLITAEQGGDVTVGQFKLAARTGMFVLLCMITTLSTRVIQWCVGVCVM